MNTQINDEVLELLKKTGAILADSHFVGTSGKHFDTYVNKDALYPHTEETSRIGELFAEKNKDINIDVVVGPALGGIILSTWTAYHLSTLKQKEILGVYTEKDADKNQIFTRGYDKGSQLENKITKKGIFETGAKFAEEIGNCSGSDCSDCINNPAHVFIVSFLLFLALNMGST